jgi:polysaccharide biosynthesis/export protein
MKRNALCLSLILLILFSISNKIFAQVQALPGLSSTMLPQLNSMSDSARKNLAAQYGFDLNDLNSGNIETTDSLGAPANQIQSEADQILYRRANEADDKRAKAIETRRKVIPIFDRDYSTIKDLPIYGQFLFDGNYSTFAPINNAPVPSDYVLGIGDSIRILMYGIEDSEISLIINREGSINFPELGSISIAGMTFAQASDFIKMRVSKQMIGIEVSISIGRLRSINIFMAGEAKVPGSYSVSGLSTVSQLLYIAGGITDIGSLRNIQVKRSNKLITTFDLYELLAKGNAEGDIRLQSGDVILVPTIKKSVFIDGAVKRPGRYELNEDERISDLVNLVGGLESRAYLKQINIERYDYNNEVPSVINLDLTNKENLEFKIVDGDIIRIAEVSDKLSNSIILRGAINRPGHYGWYENQRFSDLLSSINTDFSNNFDMEKGLIIRRKNINNYDIEAIDFSIKDSIEAPGSDDDPILKLYDEILIFSLGFNDDSLNDIELYDPAQDLNHPAYGPKDKLKNDDDAEIVESASTEIEYYQELNTNYMRERSQNYEMINKMTDLDLRIAIHESSKKAEYEHLNKGKRRLLLKPVIEKLYQQAASLESSKIVSISGAVKVPGQYPLTKNASYQDLVDLAGGYKDDAYIQAAEIRRSILDDSGAIVINTSNVDMRSFSDRKLTNRDHLYIRTIKDWDAQDMVTLVGEVFYPGSYLIGPNERLSSVIKRAGGFTSESFVKGAVFTRNSIKQKEKLQLQELGDSIRRDQAARSMTKEGEALSSSEVEASIEALLSSAVYGRLIIDIPRLQNGDQSADIVLQDGDLLMIPKFTNAVTVVGEVRRSGSFVLQDSYEVNDYLQLAAGMTTRGDKKQIYIIGADGSVKKIKQNRSWLSFEGQSDEIQAGDTLVVPIKSTYQTPLNLYSTVSQVVFQSIASIAAFTTIFK